MHVKAKISAKTPEAKRENLLSRTGKTDSSQSIRSPINHILHLQRTIGNRAVQRLFSSGAIQAKLKIGQPNDIYEQEADRVANDVMSMTAGSRQKAVSSDLNTIQKLEEEEPIQTKPLASGITPLIQRQVEEEEPIMTKGISGRTQQTRDDLHTRLSRGRGAGQPLPEADRSFMERRFGADFSGVRVHTDGIAVQMNRELNAQAFTYGRDIYFGAGRYSPNISSGKRLLAHELTHVVQQGNFRASSIQCQVSNCTSKTASDQVVKDHVVTPDTIEKPGDKVKIKVEFNCNVRSWDSDIETKTGTSLGLRKPYTRKTNKFERIWDGKKLFSKVGTFLVDDGEYRHKLSKLKYAFKYNRKTGLSDDMYATGSKLVSPAIKIKVQAYKGPGTHHYHFTTQNVNDLADIIMSEMSVGNPNEKKAIAWAVRNQMIRMNVTSVAKARDKFNDAHGQNATNAIKTIAEDILKKKMSSDITSGAIKWFSPSKMPKKRESCKGYDCSGGLVTITDNQGNKQEVYAPGFHKDMTYVPLTSVREWYLRLYKL